MSKNKSRIFLGIPISKSSHDIFLKLLQPYQSHFLNGHWILLENLHITIRFFGDIDTEKIPLLWNNVKNKVTLLSCFSLAIEKIGAFPDKNGDVVAAYCHKIFYGNS